MTHLNYIDWHTHPFRAERWLEVWRPALDRALAFGATSCYLTRDIDDPLHFRQVSVWEDKEDFERYWASDEITAMREAVFNYFNKPLLPSWHSLTAEAHAGAEAAGPTREPAAS
jgi:quinol monooxygenase YgiN